MKKLFEPFVQEIGQIIAKEASKASRQSLPGIISISITIILTLVGMVGSVLTLYMYLAESFSDRHAMLIVTAGTLFLAMFSSLIAKNIVSNKLEGIENKNESCEDLSVRNSNQQTEIATSLGIEVYNLIAKNPKNASLIAMAFGVSMGVSPELRKAIFSQFKSQK